MNWHFTWQDPVAIALALSGIALAIFFSRKAGKLSGCASCPAKTSVPKS